MSRAENIKIFLFNSRFLEFFVLLCAEILDDSACEFALAGGSSKNKKDTRTHTVHTPQFIFNASGRSVLSVCIIINQAVEWLKWTDIQVGWRQQQEVLT